MLSNSIQSYLKTLFTPSINLHVQMYIRPCLGCDWSCNLFFRKRQMMSLCDRNQ